MMTLTASRWACDKSDSGRVTWLAISHRAFGYSSLLLRGINARRKCSNPGRKIRSFGNPLRLWTRDCLIRQPETIILAVIHWPIVSNTTILITLLICWSSTLWKGWQISQGGRNVDIARTILRSDWDIFQAQTIENILSARGQLFTVRLRSNVRHGQKGRLRKVNYVGAARVNGWSARTMNNCKSR